MRSFLFSLLVLIVVFSLPAKASGWFGDVESERRFLDGIILANVGGLCSCVMLANGDGLHAKGEISILMHLDPGKSRPNAAVVHINKTGNVELGSCLVRRFEAAEIILPNEMYIGPYIIRLNVVEEWAGPDFSDLDVREPRPIGAYQRN